MAIQASGKNRNDNVDIGQLLIANTWLKNYQFLFSKLVAAEWRFNVAVLSAVYSN